MRRRTTPTPTIPPPPAAPAAAATTMVAAAKGLLQKQTCSLGPSTLNRLRPSLSAAAGESNVITIWPGCNGLKARGPSEFRAPFKIPE